MRAYLVYAVKLEFRCVLYKFAMFISIWKFFFFCHEVIQGLRTSRNLWPTFISNANNYTLAYNP